jgi:hypothetical protein|tara:strand:- start:197 stop:406 length:210 start_codon:yes stop_codon:yes gene_type:complete
MAKLTLDDVEYETDDFTDEQKQILGEVTYNNNVQTQLKYQMQGMEVMNNMLVAKLKEVLTVETTETESE